MDNEYTYKEYVITRVPSGYLVRYAGDEIYFGTMRQAMDFIDKQEEDEA